MFPNTKLLVFFYPFPHLYYLYRHEKNRLESVASKRLITHFGHTQNTLNGPQDMFGTRTWTAPRLAAVRLRRLPTFQLSLSLGGVSVFYLRFHCKRCLQSADLVFKFLWLYCFFVPSPRPKTLRVVFMEWPSVRVRATTQMPPTERVGRTKTRTNHKCWCGCWCRLDTPRADFAANCVRCFCVTPPPP